MPSSYTTNKGLEKPANGEYVDTWNVPVNADMDVLDAALGGNTALNVTGVTSTILTESQYQKLILTISGTVTGSPIYRIPSGKGGQWVVRNSSTGSVDIAGPSPDTGVNVQTGELCLIYSDGTTTRKLSTNVSSIPTGLISLWSGSIVSIPAGWALCDGTNGTPNLRDRFVIGAGSTYAVDATGGSADAIVVAHTHTGTTASSGTHNHTYTYAQGPNVSSGGGAQPYALNTITGTTSSAGAHTHTFTTDSTGSSGTGANLPPYYALAYIMKI